MSMMINPYVFAAAGGAPPALFSSAFVYLDAEDLSGADGSAISDWPDHNGGTTWTDNNCVLEVAEVNGLKAVRVPAASIGLTGPSGLLTGKTALTLIYVGTIDALTTGPCFSTWGTDGASNHYPYSDGNIYQCIGSNTRRNFGNWITFGVNAWHTCTIRAGTNYVDYRTNGVQRFTTGTNTFAVPSGQPGMGNGVLSRWGKFLVWDSVLNDTDVGTIETYLKGLYATP